MDNQPLTRVESFECDGPTELDVRVREGQIEVRTSDVSYVRVEISSQDDGEAHAVRETQVEFYGQRPGLVVRAPRGFRRSGIAVAIEAPRGSRLAARAHRGSISARGALAGLEAATGGGTITADEIDGSVEVASGSGQIELGRVAGRLRARLGSGDLEIASVEGEGARVTTGRGDVRVGRLECDANVRSGRGDIVVAEAAGGSLSLATGNGDIRVGLRAGVAAELDVASGSGRVRSDLEVSDAPPAGGPCARIRMRTGSGEAVVERAAA